MQKNNQHHRLVALFGLVVLVCAWLIPNHAMPWLSVWNEVAAFVGAFLLIFALAFSSAKASVRLQSDAAFLFIVIAVSLVANAIFGRYFFRADLLIVLLYAAAFFLSYSSARSHAFKGFERYFAWALIAGAVASCIIGMLQWLSNNSLAPFVADLPPGSSIIANVAQRNHFSSICFIGICMLLYQAINTQTSKRLLILLGLILLWGVAMAQSRTVFVQTGGMLCLALYADRKNFRHYAMTAAAMLMAFFLFKEVNTLLYLGGDRALENLSNNQGRLEIWQTMWQAFLLKPWLGYGWLQAASAHLEVAHLVAKTSGFGIIEYAHNILLDLLVWVGLPITLLIFFFLFRLFNLSLNQSKESGNLPFVIAACGIFVHSCLEYAYAYSYFLIPAAILLGLAAPKELSNDFSIKKSYLLGFTLLLAIMGSLMVWDYVRIEEDFVDARYSRTEFGKHLPTVPTKQLLLLDNVQAYHRAIAFKDWPHVPPADIQNYENIYRRYGYPAAIYDYAASSKIADPGFDESRPFKQLCSIYSAEICRSYRAKWAEDVASHPTAKSKHIKAQP